MVRPHFTHIVTPTSTAGIVVPIIEKKIVEKFCPQCRTHKLFSEFNRNRTRVDGYCSECRECESANKRRRRG